MSEHIVTLDIRETIRAGQQPCSSIMSAAANLRTGESLRLLAPFEPRPLFGVLGQQGFAHRVRPLGDGDWEVLFFRDAAGAAQAVAAAASEAADHSGCQCGSDTPAVRELDVRGLEPPQPMVQILEALAALPTGDTLRAQTDRRPMHLYPMLEARNFLAESEEQADGSFVTTIRHRPA